MTTKPKFSVGEKDTCASELKVGQRIDVYEIMNCDAYNNAVKVGSVRTGTPYMTFGADVLAPGISFNDTLYFSLIGGVVDNAVCRLVGCLIIKSLK